MSMTAKKAITKDCINSSPDSDDDDFYQDTMTVTEFETLFLEPLMTYKMISGGVLLVTVCLKDKNSGNY